MIPSAFVLYTNVLPTNILIGDTVPLTFEITQPNGDAYSLIDHTIEFLVKRSRQDSDDAALIHATLISGIVFTYTASQGVITVTLSNDRTALLRYGRLYYWQLRITTPGGQVFTPEEGTFLALNDGPM